MPQRSTSHHIGSFDDSLFNPKRETKENKNGPSFFVLRTSHCVPFLPLIPIGLHKHHCSFTVRVDLDMVVLGLLKRLLVLTSKNSRCSQESSTIQLSLLSRATLAHAVDYYTSDPTCVSWTTASRRSTRRAMIQQRWIFTRVWTGLDWNLIVRINQLRWGIHWVPKLCALQSSVC